ncbi:MAG: YkvA family protein [Ignavibacteria bacterium]
MNTKKASSDNFKVDLMEEYYPSRPLTPVEEEELGESLDKKIKSSKKSIFRILGHLKALKRYMLDGNVKWYKKSVVIAALVYFIAPIDAMPDFAPLFGYLDDMGVIAWTIKFLGSELTDFYD